MTSISIESVSDIQINPITPRSMPRTIPIVRKRSDTTIGTSDTIIGTCRSYDENIPVPSFIRSLGTESPSRSRRRAKSILFGSTPE